MNTLGHSRWFGLARVFIGLAILLGIIVWIGTEGIASEVSSMQWYWLVWLPVLWTLNLMAGGVGLFVLFRPFISLSFFSFLRYHFFSQSLGAFLPFQLGESSLVLAMRNHGVILTRAAGFFLIDKITTLLVLGILGGLGVGFFLQLAIVTWLVPGLVLVFTVLILVTISSLVRQRLVALGQRFIFPRIFQSFQVIITDLNTNRMGIIINIAMTVVRQLIIAPLYFLVLLNALGVKVFLGPLILIANITSLVSLIPITAQGLGVVELSAVYLFSLIGVPPITVTAIYVVSRPLALGFSGLILTVTGPLFDFFRKSMPSGGKQ